MGEHAVVGKSVPRVDALEKVTGKAKYVGDRKVFGMLYAKILRSPYPHAKIISIDSSKAEKLPGVKAVLTGKDVPPRLLGRYLRDRYLLCRDVVRFVGDPVAAVAAESTEIAEEAIDLIEVNYEELPAVFDVEEAIRQDHPAIVHPDLPKYEYVQTPYVSFQLEPDMPNVFNHYRIRKGDVERGFQEADLVMENRFSTVKMHHCQLEPHIADAEMEPNGSLTVTTSTQGIHYIKSQLCLIFDIPSSKIRVVSPYVGGGFGGKMDIVCEAVAVLLTLKTGRPVRVAYTREEVFIGASGREPMVIYLKDGVNRDGILIAREIKLILDSGAYGGMEVIISKNAAFGAVGTYRIPNFKLDSYGVYTNQPVSFPLRGFGSSQPIWAIECQMDMIAEKLGIDPVEMRRRNTLREGDRNVNGEITHSIGANECLDKVAQFIGWGEKLEEEGGPWRRGKGVALGNKYTVAGTSSASVVKVHDDGIIEVRHSAAEIGQGVDTVLAQIAAEEFGVSVDDVKVVARDTAVTPFEHFTGSSRVTFHAGNSVRLACQDAKRYIFTLAADILKAFPKDLAIGNKQVYVKGMPERAIKIANLFLQVVGGGVLPRGGEIIGKDTYTCPVSPQDPETGQGERVVAYYAHGAHAVEVAVNVETGEVKVIRAGGAFDAGTPINPKLCEAQIDGGIGMGIGSALYEQMVIESGVVVNPTFMDYKIPTIMEIPSGHNVGAMMVTTAPHREGPFGAKGLGEGVLTPMTPAIGNAIYNAVGVRVKDLPITREKILKGLKELKGGALPSYQKGLSV